MDAFTLISDVFSFYHISITDVRAHHRHISVGEYNHENMLWINDWKLTYVSCHVEILVRVIIELYEKINANCGGVGRLQAALGAHPGCFKVHTFVDTRCTDIPYRL